MKTEKIITIVADSHLMADNIARAIGATPAGEYHYAKEGYAVTWTNGSIVEASYNPKQPFILSDNMTPQQVYAHNFDFAVRDYDKVVGYDKKAEDLARLDAIKALFKNSSLVINATMPTPYCDLVFWNLYWYLAVPVKTCRAWLPVLTNRAIRGAIYNPRIDDERYKQYISKVIYDKFLEEDEIWREAEAEEQAQQALKAAENKEDSEEKPVIYNGQEVKLVDYPVLPSFLSLLVTASAEFGYNHDETADAVLRLYLKKLISFPSDIQSGVPYSVWRNMKRNMRMLRYNSRWGEQAKALKKLSRRCVIKGVSDGAYETYGIVTTGLHPTDLTGKERIIYDHIVKQVIDAFTPFEGE